MSVNLEANIKRQNVDIDTCMCKCKLCNVLWHPEFSREQGLRLAELGGNTVELATVLIWLLDPSTDNRVTSSYHVTTSRRSVRLGEAAMVDWKLVKRIAATVLCQLQPATSSCYDDIGVYLQLPAQHKFS